MSKMLGKIPCSFIVIPGIGPGFRVHRTLNGHLAHLFACSKGTAQQGHRTVNFGPMHDYFP